MAACNHDIQLVVSAGARSPGAELRPPAPARDRNTGGHTGKDSQLFQVRGDPPDALEQFVTDQADPTLIDERRPRGGAQYGVENNPFPQDCPGVRSQKGGNLTRYAGASQHADLDTGQGDVLRQALQRLPHKAWRERLDRPDTQRRLHRHGGDAGHAIDPMSRKGLQVGGNSGPGPGIKARDGERYRVARFRGRNPIESSVFHRFRGVAPGPNPSASVPCIGGAFIPPPRGREITVFSQMTLEREESLGRRNTRLKNVV